MKHLPNLITLSRIASSLALLPVQAFSPAFFIIYTYCGISDVLDGFLARKLHCNHENGARLDSIADIVFYAVTAFKIMPVICSKLTILTWCIIAASEELIIHISTYQYCADKKSLFLPKEVEKP